MGKHYDIRHNCIFAKVALSIKTCIPIFPILCRPQSIIELYLSAHAFLALLFLNSAVNACFCGRKQKHCLMAMDLDSSCALHSCSDLFLPQNISQCFSFFTLVIERTVKSNKSGCMCVFKNVWCTALPDTP